MKKKETRGTRQLDSRITGWLVVEGVGESWLELKEMSRSPPLGLGALGPGAAISRVSA